MIVLDIKDREWRNGWLLQFKAILALYPPLLPPYMPLAGHWADNGHSDEDCPHIGPINGWCALKQE